jgi:hypothetical protein
MFSSYNIFFETSYTLMCYAVPFLLLFKTYYGMLHFSRAVKREKKCGKRKMKLGETPSFGSRPMCDLLKPRREYGRASLGRSPPLHSLVICLAGELIPLSNAKACFFGNCVFTPVLKANCDFTSYF